MTIPTEVLGVDDEVVWSHMVCPKLYHPYDTNICVCTHIIPVCIIKKIYSGFFYLLGITCMLSTWKNFHPRKKPSITPACKKFGGISGEGTLPLLISLNFVLFLPFSSLRLQSSHIYSLGHWFGFKSSTIYTKISSF